MVQEAISNQITVTAVIKVNEWGADHRVTAFLNFATMTIMSGLASL